MNRLTKAAIDGARVESCGELRARLHPRCVVCSPDHPCGLCLRFVTGPDDTVMAEFQFDPAVEGYVGWLHGGITSAVLDGAMTNWLFAHGLTCVTAELKVRFRHPVVLGEPATVTARLASDSHPLYELQACIHQNGQLKVRAVGRFMYKEYATERA